jgi:hypothetical protein
MPEPPPAQPRAAWVWGAGLVVLAFAARLVWVLAVPTVPVSDFAMYRESANFLSEFGRLDRGFIYMPGFVALLAWIKDLGGDLLAQKLLGVFFGGLGAAGLYLLTLSLLELRAAIVATAIYALWPAGIAMSSVVGTDVPAAALVVVALAVLAWLAPRRPLAAAIAFGAVMGLAAWVRAVALPLTVLSAGYWLARRAPLRLVAARSAAAVATTLLVLLPWGVYHLGRSGELYFTDDHGGITALIGANPNSEGRYTRALNEMFEDLTGRSVLDEPHRAVDREAYQLAREWARFEPAYSAGLVVMKAERLFGVEQRLLYWPIFRPGVLVGPRGAWFEARHQAIGDAANRFGLAVVALALAGIGAALARRRWTLLALLPFQLALIATYTLFFAEPRYRLPIEMLAFLFVALALVELARATRALAVRAWPDLRAFALPAATGLGLIAVWLVGWPRLVDAGAGLRARHRWAATEWRVNGAPRLCKWRPVGAPLPAVSHLEGAPNGVRLRSDGAAPVGAAIELGSGPLPAGAYDLHLRLEPAGAPARLQLAGADGPLGEATATPPAASTLDVRLHHGGGTLRLAATLAGTASQPASSVWITDARLDAAAPKIAGKIAGKIEGEIVGENAAASR